MSQSLSGSNVITEELQLSNSSALKLVENYSSDEDINEANESRL